MWFPPYYQSYWGSRWPAVCHRGGQPHRWALLLCPGPRWWCQAPVGCSGYRCHQWPVCVLLRCLIPKTWSFLGYLYTPSSDVGWGGQSQKPHSKESKSGRSQWGEEWTGGGRGMGALGREKSARAMKFKNITRRFLLEKLNVQYIQYFIYL